MKTIVISDIHNRVQKAQAIIDKEKPDKTILLGDIFDGFRFNGDDDGEEEAEASATWLKKKMDEGVIPVIGNHDVGYIHPVSANCPGYTKEKCRVIRSILTKEYMDQFKLFHWHEGVLLSHAGLHADLVPARIKGGIPEFRKWLEREGKRAMDLLSVGMFHPLLARGTSTGGLSNIGGIYWCRFFEFKPIPGVDQIFGHSCMALPHFSNEDGSVTINLDTCNNHYVVFNDSTVSIETLDPKAAKRHFNAMTSS